MGDSSVFVLSRTGHFEYSPVHNSVNINGRNFILHLHGSCHMCVSMCDQDFFVNYFNWLIYSELTAFRTGHQISPTSR